MERKFWNLVKYLVKTGTWFNTYYLRDEIVVRTWHFNSIPEKILKGAKIREGLNDTTIIQFEGMISEIINKTNNKRR